MAIPARERQLRVLVLAGNYPTSAAPQRGLWVQRMCDVAAEGGTDVRVIVPTPWVPPFVPVQYLSRFRRVPQRERYRAVDAYFPRVPGWIEYLTHPFDARLAGRPVLRLAAQLHHERPFDLIHAHFIYPDGVLAARLGRELGIPVMTSEHAFWTPWLVDKRRVGAQVDAALPHIRLVTAVSQFLREGIEGYARGRVALDVLPNVVDDEVFGSLSTDSQAARDPNEILFVGLIRRVKRLDVLLRAVADVRRVMPCLRLRILSANAFRAYGSDRDEVRSLISSLGLESAVTIVNGTDPAGVAEAMRRCAFVVVSSARRETFCSVAAEALACGTPLVITRCGGPEEYVTPADGVMVPPDDASALAAGIIEAFRRRDTFDSAAMRERIVGRFGRVAWRATAMETYERVATRGIRAPLAAGALGR
jgi:glycosyltransferase involved in cell wall biosynthesis